MGKADIRGKPGGVNIGRSLLGRGDNPTVGTIPEEGRSYRFACSVPVGCNYVEVVGRTGLAICGTIVSGVLSFPYGQVENTNYAILGAELTGSTLNLWNAHSNYGPQAAYYIKRVNFWQVEEE